MHCCTLKIIKNAQVFFTLGCLPGVCSSSATNLPQATIPNLLIVDAPGKVILIMAQKTVQHTRHSFLVIDLDRMMGRRLWGRGTCHERYGGVGLIDGLQNIIHGTISGQYSKRSKGNDTPSFLENVNSMRARPSWAKALSTSVQLKNFKSYQP